MAEARIRTQGGKRTRSARVGDKCKKERPREELASKWGERLWEARLGTNRRGGGGGMLASGQVQGYLAHKKTPTPSMTIVGS